MKTLNLRTINISAIKGAPLDILMDTGAPKVVENLYKNNKAIQDKVHNYFTALELIERWAAQYQKEHKIFTSSQSDKIPTTLEALKEQVKNQGFFYVDSTGSESCLWSHDCNIAIRHLHDSQHIAFVRGMGAQDEKFLALQLATAISADISKRGDNTYSESLMELVFTMVYTDFARQTDYWMKHRAFVQNQQLFTNTCLFNCFDIFKFTKV